VVAGTAGAVAHHQNQKYAAQEQEAYAEQTAIQSQDQIADLQAQVSAMQSQQAASAAQMVPVAYAPAAYAPPAYAPPGPDVMTQLQQLAEMKQSGLLSEAEFQAAKAKLLAG
jgi:2,4-dienoyl-CoA reductase-like NADH-dependent reductase (Old Yellow Enzyme family)